MINVWVCTKCAWSGARIISSHGGRRRFVQPEACERCRHPLLAPYAASHPKFTHLCACGEWFIGGMYARECLKCRGLHAAATAWSTRTRKYDWTAEREDLLRRRYNSRVKGRVAELARALGWPTWVIKKRATQLGIAARVVHRLEWTPAHVAVLEEWTGMRTSRWIARFMTRKFGERISELAVVNKQKRLDWNRRVRSDRLTMMDLEHALGVDHRVIAGWVQSGKLHARRGASERPHPVYEFDERDILTFIRDYRTLIHLDRVDADWFLGLVLPPRSAFDERSIRGGPRREPVDVVTSEERT